MDLRAKIEETFTGIVFFIYGYTAAQIRIVLFPRREPVSLYARYNNSIGPYSALLVTLVLGHFVILGSTLHDLSAYLRGGLPTSLQTSIKEWVIASFLTVAYVDVMARFHAWRVFPDRRRRKRFVSVVLYAVSPVMLISALVASLATVLVQLDWLQFGQRDWAIVGVTIAISMAVSYRCLYPAYSYAQFHYKLYERRLHSGANLRSRVWHRINNPGFPLIPATLPLALAMTTALADFSMYFFSDQSGLRVVESRCPAPATPQGPLAAYVLLENASDRDLIVSDQTFSVSLAGTSPFAMHIVSDLRTAETLPFYLVKAGETEIFKLSSLSDLTWKMDVIKGHPYVACRTDIDKSATISFVPWAAKP